MTGLDTQTTIQEAAILARHVPILRMDGSERFGPTAVDGFVANSVLVDGSGATMSPPDLRDLDGRWGRECHLRFVTDDERNQRTGRLRSRRFRTSSSRLARVGLFGRLIDALFLLSVWIRPTVPRGTTQAALEKALDLGLHDRPTCYGRVVSAGEWLVAHYAFFYVMNDWRSSHRGLNDHEGDWEQAWIYLDPVDQTPIWVATTSHEHQGPDSRRHWDDAELEVCGDRPVLYAAAGSHALFYRPGHFVSRIDIPGFRWLFRLQRSFQQLLRRPPTHSNRGAGPALGVPFIDWADGLGAEISQWQLEPMTGHAWLESFRGRWGHDTRDPLNGERGPSGPKFDREGQVRASWADPLGFAGLHGSPPPSATASRVNLEKIEHALSDLDDDIRRRGRLLPLLHQTARTSELRAESAHLTELLRQQTELVDLRNGLRVGQPRIDGIRDHLRRPAVPIPATDRSAWVRDGWAALTVPAILCSVAMVLLFDRLSLGLVVLGVAACTIPLDHAIRGHRRRAFRLGATGVAALLFATFLVPAMWQRATVATGSTLVVGALILLAVNLHELLQRPDTDASTSPRAGAEFEPSGSVPPPRRE